MYEQPADFFLGSSDSRGEFAKPRACWIIARLRMENGRECVLVDVDPPVIGQPFGLGDRDITNLVLAARWTGTSFELNCYPMPVLIYRIIGTVENQNTVRDSDVNMEAWGEVYPTLEGAEHASDPSSGVAWSQRARR